MSFLSRLFGKPETVTPAQAAAVLSQHRQLSERARIRATARQMRLDMGKEPLEALR